MDLPARSQCVIAGGGPAGLMLGMLLARAGVAVTVLEKHADFLRDFRGDTIHPSTMEVLHELGLLDAFLRLPHEKVARIFGRFGGLTVPFAEFSQLPVHAPFIAMMPQWDFLDFLADEARRFPNFHLAMNAEAIDLLNENGRVVGVRLQVKGGGMQEIRGDLVVAADGRQSILRQRAGMMVRDLGAPMDVLWFRLSRQPSDSAETIGRFDPGAIFVGIYRGTYWQCAYVIPKGGIQEIKAQGLAAFKSRLAASLDPLPAARADELQRWDDIKLLTVAVDRLESWHKPGFLCIGDAAHAMSPIGGVGINLAVQDAVAAANILASPLREGRVNDELLASVQKRRLWPTRVTQALQVGIQNNVIAPTLRATGTAKPPLPVRMLMRFPLLRRLPARLVGLGVRPEHVADEIRRAGSAAPTRP